MSYCNLHTTHQVGTAGQNVVENHTMISEVSGTANDAQKQKGKLKGKRAVVKWLKFFRWKKKKEYERMTSEEKILFKLRKVSHEFMFACSLQVPKNCFKIETCMWYSTHLMFFYELSLFFCSKRLRRKKNVLLKH